MRKLVLILSVIALISFAITSCSGSPEKETENKDSIQGANVQYTCSMHPEVLQDKPGDCPKCGMDLIEKK